MRGLKINSKIFYYANYVRTDPVMSDDEIPIATGEFEIIYTDPVSAEGSFSSVKGEATARIFGLSDDYDSVITLHNQDLGITSASVLWVDDVDPSHPYDYIVKKVAPNLNVTLIAIKKVDVSG